MADLIAVQSPITGLQDTMRQIYELAKTRGDSFRTRIFRRTGNAAPKAICGLDNVTAEHLATPEAWMPQLVGGGSYHLLVYHLASDGVTTPQGVGEPIVVSLDGQARDPDHSTLAAPGWMGPPTMYFPAKPRPQQVAPQGLSISVPTGDSGGDAQGPQLYRVTESREASALRNERDEVERKQRALADEQRKVEVERAREEAKLQSRLAHEAAERRVKEAEDRAREEQRALSAKLERLEAKLTEAPKESAIEKLLPSLMPLALKMFESAKEEQRRMFEAAQAQQQRADERFQQLMLKLSEPKNDVASEAIAKITAAQGQLFNTTLGVFSSLMEQGLMGGPKEEDPWIRLVEKGLSTFGAFAARKKREQREATGPTGAKALPSSRGGAAGAVAAAAPAQLRVADSAPGAMAQIVAMLEKKETPAVVAEFMVAHAMDEDVQDAMLEAEGNFAVVLVNELGPEWPKQGDNREYLSKVAELFVRGAVKQGLMPESFLAELPDLLEDLRNPEGEEAEEEEAAE